MAVVSLKNICYNYHTAAGETAALEDVSLSVEEGEFVSLIGPSGCGKSTLLSIVSGLIAPGAGELELAEGVSVGYMLQRDHLFGWRTIRGNARLGLELKRDKSKESRDYVDELLKKYGLWEFRDFPPSRLSGGMRQRAALIRTLAAKPGLLLLDEPFSALDYQTRLFIGAEVSEILRGEGKTALMVTHDISEAISLSDRVIVLSGRPAKVAATHDVGFASPKAAREAPEFRYYFNRIWKELDVHA